VIEAAKWLGMNTCEPWIDEDIRSSRTGGNKRHKLLNRAGEACKKAGIQFAYQSLD